MKNKKNNISMMSEIKRKEHEAILKNSLIAILYLYKDRDIRWVNRRFTEMFGYTAKELEGRSVSIIHVDQQHFREFGEKYYTDLKFKNVNIDWPFKTKDGRVIICRVTGQAINRDNLEEGIIWLLDDISETVKAEEQLRKNKKLYEYLFHASIDAIFLMDSGGKLLKTNDAAGRLLGYTCDEFKKLHIEDIDIQFDRNAFKKFWSHKPIGESLIFETYHKHKNGGIIPVEVNGIVFEMDDNRYFYGIARNIQGRMKMTEELSKSEEKYRILAETAKDLIVMHDLKGRIHYANEYTLDVTGYSLKEMMKMNVLEIVDPEYHDLIRKNNFIRVSGNSRKNSYQVRIRSKSGESISLDVGSSPVLKDGRVKSVLIIARDISNIILSEKKTKKSEEKFASIFQQNPNWISIVNAETYERVDINESFTEITGYSREEIIGKKIGDISLYDNESIREFLEKMKTSTSIRKYRMELITKNGQRRVLLLNSDIIEIDGVKHILTTGQDITDLIEAENNLKEKNRELELARNQAEEADKLKAAFLANMSHEIRTPMNAILGFTNMLKDSLSSPDEMNEYIDVIQKSGNQLLSLIDDIIVFSKIESRLLFLEPSQCNVTEVLQGVMKDYDNQAYLAHKPKLKLIVNIPEKDQNAIFYTDPMRLRQVLDNLISNAVKHTEEGVVEASYEIRDGYIHFRIKDTGYGIPEKDHEAVFERFYQSGESSFHEGTGLGLSICRGIVDLMNGSINMESKLGKGSDFRFRLPYFEGPDDYSQEKDGKDVQTDLDGLTAYVAEDDLPSFTYIRHILDKSGILCVRAVNGIELLNMLNEKQPDFIILDLNMPEMNGYEFLKEYRKRGYNIPVIAQTAYVLSDEKQKCINAGCRGYVSKPVTENNLLEAVYSAMKKRVE